MAYTVLASCAYALESAVETPDVWALHVTPLSVDFNIVPESPTAQIVVPSDDPIPRRLLLVPEVLAVHVVPPSDVVYTVPLFPAATTAVALNARTAFNVVVSPAGVWSVHVTPPSVDLYIAPEDPTVQSVLVFAAETERKFLL